MMIGMPFTELLKCVCVGGSVRFMKYIIDVSFRRLMGKGRGKSLRLEREIMGK